MINSFIRKYARIISFLTLLAVLLGTVGVLSSCSFDFFPAAPTESSSEETSSLIETDNSTEGSDVLSTDTDDVTEESSESATSNDETGTDDDESTGGSTSSDGTTDLNEETTTVTENQTESNTENDTEDNTEDNTKDNTEDNTESDTAGQDTDTTLPSVSESEGKSEDETEGDTESETKVELDASLEKYKGVFISKVYGPGTSNFDAAVGCGFIELYNSNSNEVDMGGAALIYGENGAYTRYDFPEGVKIPARSHYLIKCKSVNNYDESYAVFKIESFDAEWAISVDNNAYVLILTDKQYRPNKDAVLYRDKYVVSYVEASLTPNVDIYSIDGVTKNKMVVRTELSENVGYYTLNLSRALSIKLQANTPQTSAGEVNTYVQSRLNEVVFSSPAGFYTKTVSLGLTAPEGYSTIYYTLDGSDPTTSSTRLKYTGKIALADSSALPMRSTTQYAVDNINSNGGRGYEPNGNMIGGYVVKAYATDGTNSTGVYTNTYFVSSKMAGYDVSVMSFSMGLDQLFYPGTGFYTNYYAVENIPNVRGNGMLEVFDEDGNRRGYSAVEMAVSGHGSSNFLMKSIRVYIKGTNNMTDGLESSLNYDLFGGYAENTLDQDITKFTKFMLRNSGNDCGQSYIRDAFMQKVSKDLNVDTMASTSVLIFINGEFWGVYNARERYSDDYVVEHYGANKDGVAVVESDYNALVAGKNQGAPYILSSGPVGAETSFNDLVTFIRNNDLTIQENYDYVCANIDIDSFIDMYVARIYFNARDWPENNIKIWRDITAPEGSELAKWHFTLLDMDMGIAFYPNGHMHDTGENADFSSLWYDATGNAIGTIMHKLRQNEDFKSKYVTRYCKVVNEIYTPEYLQAELDKIVAEREPIFDLQIKRWWSDGASRSSYNTSIANMTSFIKNRNPKALEYMYRFFNINEEDVTGKTEQKVDISFSSSRVDVELDGVTVENGYVISLGDTGETVTINIQATAKDGYTVTSITYTPKTGDKIKIEGDTASFDVSVSGTVTIQSKRNSTEGMLPVQSGIVASENSMFYLDDDGTLYAWGYNGGGILGTGSTATYISTPTLVMEDVAKIAPSHSNDTENGNHNIAVAILTRTGEVYTIGYNGSGQLGNGNTTAQSTWTLIAFDGKVVDVSMGHDHLLILDENGDVWGVGSNSKGQLGEINFGKSVKSFQKIASDAIAISAGRGNSVYIDSNKDCYVLGDNRWNKFNTISGDSITTPYLVLSDVAYIESGEHQMLFITSDGDLYYTGWRDFASFSQSTGGGTGGAEFVCSDVSKAVIHFSNLIILKNDGSVQGYGLNQGNVLGGTYTNGILTTIIYSGVVDIASGYAFAAVQLEDGTVYTIGDNSYGQAGTGTTGVSNPDKEPARLP